MGRHEVVVALRRRKIEEGLRALEQPRERVPAEAPRPRDEAPPRWRYWKREVVVALLVGAAALALVVALALVLSLPDPDHGRPRSSTARGSPSASTT